MKLVEEDARGPGREPIQPQALDQGSRSSQQSLPVVIVVPVDVEVGVGPAGGRLPHLARAAHEGHLPMLREVVGEEGVVDALRAGHSDH